LSLSISRYASNIEVDDATSGNFLGIFKPEMDEAGLAFIYYTLLYPAAVIGGVISGILSYLLNKGEFR